MKTTRKVKIILIVVLLLSLVICNIAGLGSFDYWSDKGDVTIAVTGDVMIGRNVPGVLNGAGSAFGGIGEKLSNVNILLINFENAATTSSSAVKGDVPLKTAPSNIKSILVNNNTVAGLANNHVFDYGKKGAKDTWTNLESNGIVPIGAGVNASDASQPYVKEINGRKITILNYMDSENFAEYPQSVIPMAKENSSGYAAYDKEVMEKQIHDARVNGSDFVLVYFHYGNEYTTSPNTNQKEFSHAAIDAGADAVVGSHPHVPQGIEVYHGKTIFYSLGDTVFDLQRAGTTVSYFVVFNLTGGQCVATVYPIKLSGYLPYFMNAANGKSLLSSLSPSCDEMVINKNGTGTIVFNLTDPRSFN